jgi:ATP:cob(I)alamin adenosyltransferase
MTPGLWRTPIAMKRTRRSVLPSRCPTSRNRYVPFSLRSRTTCSTWAQTTNALRINENYVTRLEGYCDDFNEDLPALTSFVLPGGTPLAAQLHVARTVSRRAERAAWASTEEFPDSSALPAKYLNRLSDLLFILGRVANSGNDVLWKPGANRG